MYLFFRRKFSWDNKGFGAYIGLFGLLGIFAQYGLLPFMSNRLKFHDLTIGMSKISGTSLAHYFIIFPSIGVSREKILPFRKWAKSVVKIGVPINYQKLW